MESLHKMGRIRVKMMDVRPIKVKWEIFFIFCIVVTVINDHFLKPTFGNFLTGKLSDVFGPFVLLRLLMGIRGIGFSTVWAGFITLIFCIAIKVAQPFADLVADISCYLPIFFRSACQIIADPNDLIAFLPIFVFLLVNEKKEFIRT